ncbi:lipase family protein [Microbacterium ulmi]|uniref:Secretory lipase n=1 Tax=Microbacterium ulmi TaxID=179095 RepID=A0A7Y2M0I5_9MICO|nr:lipase family protein [Microbacterium ulmi]NII69199.1 uncharacterized membrane protein HdeD (DUF308 family)/alpha-beta hydrolase superfamily lysophospholipase [Microbacterium ulmi]NNH03739.1 hypothetical protein [Microbacterium ulmi]
MTQSVIPRGRIRPWFARLPRWVRAVVGLASVALGAVVITRPTTSLGVLALLIGAGLVLAGLLELVGGGQSEEGERTPRWHVLAAVLWIVAGVFVLVFPGLTVRVVALVVGVALIVNGVLSVLSVFRRGQTLDARIAALLLGLAGVAFGLLALLWPDITLLIVAVVFGARLVIVGLLELWRAVRGARAVREGTDAAPSALSRWTRTIAAVAAVVLAVAAGAASVALRSGAPVTDDFYAAPRTVPSEPGQLIRSEPFTREVPEGARAWRILYTTTNGDGTPAVASGLVVVPAEGFGKWPVIEWTHGTTGFAQQCAPSLLAEPFESGALFVLPEILANGWALVATDYIGLGTGTPHPYLIGQPTGRAALDSVRAARQLEAADLGGQTVAWGHSQGGAAALWAGAIADSYAPDVGLAGVAALAPASNLPGLIDALPDVPGGSIFGSFAIAGFTSIYPDVTFREYVRPGAEVTVREAAGRCLAEPGVFASLLTALGLSRDPEIMAKSPNEGPFGRRLVENIPPATITAPVLLAQGKDDPLVTPAAQDAFVRGLCDAGRPVDYRLYAGRSHVQLVEPDSPLVPQLVEWTKARLSGEPGLAACNRAEY